MDHSLFKANQTAAVYVADGLDAPTLEAFEMHMMACPECVDDVETWRAIKINMPSRVRRLSTAAALGRRARQAATWRMAASVLVAGIIGATGGWFGHEAQSPPLGADRTVFFNMPAIERGASDCTPVRLAAQSRLAVLRVSGLTADTQLVALNSDRHELPAGSYQVAVQPDNSRQLRLDAQSLVNREIRLETRGADGSSEPYGCVTGEIVHAQ